MNNVKPSFREYFDGLVAQKKREIHKASDEDAFDAAYSHIENQFPFRPDFGFKAYKARKNKKIAQKQP